ncbi:MAG: hypothetical protein GF353_13350 [Candidatus Lokiarchaeota archaeon]|nr:hypothetical protein [Candidatus Lokiarchaeota archaeon]
MLKFMLPDEIDIGIQPELDADKNTLEVYFSVNDKPIIEFICKQIIDLDSLPTRRLIHNFKRLLQINYLILIKMLLN